MMTSFRNLNTAEKIDFLRKGVNLSPEEMKHLNKIAEHADLMTPFSENVIGAMQLPFSIVPNVQIDDELLNIPFSIEESSVVAALANAAKTAQQHGQLTTDCDQPFIIAQVYIPEHAHCDLPKLHAFKEELIRMLNHGVASSMTKRGGGIEAVTVNAEKKHVLIHIKINPCDAHGANLACQVGDVAREILISTKIISHGYAILSNQTTATTKAKIHLSALDPEMVQAMVDMSHFATISTARAVTHNKGIMNGIDGILLATGNDWRANSSNCHSYAAHNGPMTTWHAPTNNELIGEITIPLQLGTVGGLTKSHPTAALALAILNHPSRKRLQCITAAVGLLQNFAALRAIGSHQLIKGHMGLHLSNRLLAQGQSPCPEKISKLKQKMQAKGYISDEDIKNA